MKKAVFYDANSQAQKMIIGDGYFAILFTQDVHMPQLRVHDLKPEKTEVIKKEIV